MRIPSPPTPKFLLSVYRHGFFPMARGRDSRRPLEWFNPEERGIIPLDAFHLPRRLKDRLRSRRFVVTTDHDFPAVISACAGPRDDGDETWINQEIISAYTDLHGAGHAHSIEAWLPDEASGEAALVGGLYGVHIGGGFFAESMFSRPDLGGTDASKVCLAHLMLHLQRRGFRLLDTQYWNEHLDQFGCVEIPRAEYLAALEPVFAAQTDWQPFDPEANIASLAV